MYVFGFIAAKLQLSDILKYQHPLLVCSVYILDDFLLFFRTLESSKERKFFWERLAYSEITYL